MSAEHLELEVLAFFTQLAVRHGGAFDSYYNATQPPSKVNIFPKRVVVERDGPIFCDFSAPCRPHGFYSSLCELFDAGCLFVLGQKLITMRVFLWWMLRCVFRRLSEWSGAPQNLFPRCLFWNITIPTVRVGAWNLPLRRQSQHHSRQCRLEYPDDFEKWLTVNHISHWNLRRSCLIKAHRCTGWRGEG